MPRLFVALEIPEFLRQRLKLLGGGIPGARWVAEENLHLTLTFIGEVPPSASKAIDGALARVDAEAFALGLRGVGVFPPRGVPNVIWAGLDPSPGLLDLKSRVDRALTGAGIDIERRKYAPHITLARLRNPSRDRVAAFVAHQSLLASEPFPVERFCLMSSVLSPRGAKYRIERSYPLDTDPDMVS